MRNTPSISSSSDPKKFAHSCKLLTVCDWGFEKKGGVKEKTVMLRQDHIAKQQTTRLMTIKNATIASCHYSCVSISLFFFTK